MRIGVLEDDPALRIMLKEMLEPGGHVVSTYTTGLDILAALFVDSPETVLPQFDILLVDLFVPGEIAGQQVIHQVKTLYPDLPIIVISAATSQDLQTVQRRYPGVNILQKPFKLRDLRAFIDQNRDRKLLPN